MQRLVCAFTGHRPAKLSFQYNESAPECVRLKAVLYDHITALADSGVTDFLSGMALGTDMWAAELVLMLKKERPDVALFCILPCASQPDAWPPESRKRYFDILNRADGVHYVRRAYTKGCMLERNRYLVDHAHFVLAVYNGELRGGTAATVRYANSLKRALITIHPETLDALFTFYRPADKP